MKTEILTLIAIFAVGTAFAEIQSQEVSVKLGPKKFLDGDVVRIDSVRSTSPKLEVGDQVTVTGMYRLDSQPAAKLALYLTQIESDGIEETDAGQIVSAKRGWHEFTASITIKHRGHLHLTFYDDSTGTPFGGVYFGTPEQVDVAMAVSLDHYPTER
ncbi:MAG: hypothetical protein WD342_05230 [Verrucomicrobiales bacterium]